MERSQNEFEERLKSLIRQFAHYENDKSRSTALKYVDLPVMREIAQAKYDSLPDEEKGKDSFVDSVKDILLLDLMEWFKTEFFTWMDTPKCTKCQQVTISKGSTQPTQDEIFRSASRVELYICKDKNCSTLVRFPRYNNPVILLDTRTGRCGEWANCFALICSAAGYEIRHVSDWTDHVWIEVFSPSQNAWIHVDCCENSYDSPLLYEKGWGKKLSYIIAISKDDIQDVTWRYTINFKETLSRRNLCNEKWLVSKIIQLRKSLQSNISQERREIVQSRMMRELIDLLTPKLEKETKDLEKIGRTSGSLAWRLSRQETGQTQNANYDFSWIINLKDLINGRIEFSYDCHLDKYTLGDNIKYGWSNGAFKFQNIFRKEEKDWKMVYLAREGDSSPQISGWISWRFILEKCPKLIQINFQTTSFHSSTLINLKIKTEEGNEFPITDCQNGTFKWTNENNFIFKSFQLYCEIKGGESWQHAQIFRQAMNPVNSREQCPFHIILIFD